jgi:YjbE family integral membrane protein
MELDSHFWLRLLEIIYVNIILSGDNAVVIALACRGLPAHQQKWGILLGAGCAVVLRIVFTIFIAYLLTVPYLKVVGGLLLFWVGYKLMMPQDEGENVTEAQSLMHAVRIVLIADAVMSLDNVIAVAAAAKGDYTLLIIGLVISVPLVVYGATLLIKLIDKFPSIVPGGAALIGYIGAEIMETDPVWQSWIEGHVTAPHLLLPLLGAVLIVLFGRIAAPKAHPPVTGEVAAGAAIMTARILLMRSPLVIVFLASLFGYTIAGYDEIVVGHLTPLDEIIEGLMPILAAVIAIVVGEGFGRLANKLRGTPSMFASL